MTRNAFQIPKRSVMAERQPVRNKPKPGSYFHIASADQWREEAARRAALKKTSI